MIFLKFYENGVVSFCDASLIGKHFEDAKHSLNVLERFYKGKRVIKKKVFEILSLVRSMNFVGKTVVDIALKGKFIYEKDVPVIQGVPHVQIYTFD